MTRTMLTVLGMCLVAGVLLPSGVAAAADVKLSLPQGRTAFQTNERIDLAVTRTAKGDLPTQTLKLTVSGESGQLVFTFPVQGGKASGGTATVVDHLHLNGWMLRPGAYTVQVACGDASDKKTIEVFSHVRKSTFRTIHWGGPKGKEMIAEGEDGMGFNLILGGVDESSIRAKVDIMGVCVMGGMHQHDGKLYCDWSDPYVYIGAIQRGMDRAQSFRTMPNAIGAHLHDEPGLTHTKHPHTGKMGPHDVAQQRAAHERAYGRAPIWFDEADTKDPAKLKQWSDYNDFRLGFMDAFWKAAGDSFERLKPGFLAVTQSQYGWSALYDGYYFNVARSLPVISGHGGYNDFGLRNFNASFFLEFSLPRQLDKPTWYLPEWYDLTSEQYKLEHYMSFITGIQGLSAPPGLRIKSKGAPGVTEANKVMARLGTIFARPAYTRAPLAILYSKSDAYKAKRTRQVWYMAEVYMASKMIQQPISVVLEEDILDGTLAAEHKAVVITGVQYLDPDVVKGLSDFAAGDGVVLVTDECKVEIPGATRLGVAVQDYYAVSAPKLQAIQDADKRRAEAAKLYSFDNRVKFAEPVAKALKAALGRIGISPAFVTDSQRVAAGRQVRGEIEYIFAVNFATQGQVPAGGAGQPAAQTAHISLPDDGRAVYDAMDSGPAKFDGADKRLVARVQFGPGEMKAYARTARPIGAVLVAKPVLNRDLTRMEAPVRMELAATLVDKGGRILSGTAPLRIVVKDPAGAVRYDLYRATAEGVCKLTLPLAANDPAGQWTVEATDLLAGTTGKAAFDYEPLTRCQVMAGAGRRAIYYPYDKENIYRFFRDQRTAMIVVGSGGQNAAAAQRLAAALKPYNVTCEIVKAADVPARELSKEEAATWCGTYAAGRLKTGRANPPEQVGFDLPHPAIVLGTPEDNRLIKLLSQRKVLPFEPSAAFPGAGRGMLAWNLHTLGHDVQAIACVAYDSEGMAQAVGTLFEIAAGLDPLTRWQLPASGVFTPAK